jgi:hypothetical protein
MMRRVAFVVASIVGLTVVADMQQRRPPSGSDYFAGSWMINPAKTINWTGRDNTTFEFIMFTVEDDVQSLEGIHKHSRRRNSVRYNEFDPVKANYTNVNVYGNNAPPNTQLKTDDHLVTLKVDDRTHVSFNKNGGGFFRHMAPNLKEYTYVGFNADGTVPLHRWSTRVKKAGDANLPDSPPKTN